MLITILTRSLLVVSLQATATPVAHPYHTADPDSARLLRTARSEQATFEAVRRRHLPISQSSGGECDARIGRFCYWVDETPKARPAEHARITAARERLVAVLDSVQARVPGDGWIRGQRIRYLLEAGRNTEAREAASGCVGDTTWCHALAGYAFHATGEYRAADAAFHRALEAMAPDERCEWLDPSMLVEDRIEKRVGHRRCDARDRFVARVWWTATPLFLVGVNDLRTEHFARLVRSRIERYAKSPQATTWGTDMLELMTRYGWPEWYARTLPSAGSQLETSITGHDPVPSFAFFPSHAAMDSIGTAPANAWDLRIRSARSRYAPPYMKHLSPLRHQLAVFRRGDSALVVAAYDARGDTLFSDASSRAGLFLTWEADSLAASEVHGGAKGVLLARAPWRPLLGSVELHDTSRLSVSRARYGVPLPPRAGRVGVSDLLLFAKGASTPARLEDAISGALSSMRVAAAEPLGIFWETYGLRPTGEALGVAITIEEIGTPLGRRIARALHLMDGGAPLRVRWQEVPDRGTNVASRAVVVSLSRLVPGRYRVRLTVTPEGEAPAIATREVEVVR